MTKATRGRERCERIELRATPEQKRLLSRAAALEHTDLTSFVLRAAVPLASQVVAEAERLVLSARDAQRVLDLLENPPPPTDALLAAARADHDTP